MYFSKRLIDAALRFQLRRPGDLFHRPFETVRKCRRKEGKQTAHKHGGNGEDRKQRLAAAGYDYWTVQNLVNGLAKGYDAVARDVINGKYGNDQARINALRAKGFDPNLVQAIVNGMLK